MDTDVVQQVAHYAEEVLGGEGFRYASAVVANCKMLALELEMDEEYSRDVDMEALVLAGYLHDISTTTSGFQDHQRKSAQMAVEYLRKLDVPEERRKRVEQAILGHTTAVSEEQHDKTAIEALVLYDADRLGRLSGLAVVTSLIEFGSRYPNRAVTGDGLVAILRHIEERFIDLYQSLHTQPARDLARAKFQGTLAFLDGVIEHLNDATPV
jgi:predicted hydrolase (HD superfamily)